MAKIQKKKKKKKKREIQQFAFNRASDIVIEDLMNLYQICTAKSNLASDNPLCFKNNF